MEVELRRGTIRFQVHLICPCQQPLYFRSESMYDVDLFMAYSLNKYYGVLVVLA